MPARLVPHWGVGGCRSLKLVILGEHLECLSGGLAEGRFNEISVQRPGLLVQLGGGFEGAGGDADGGFDVARP